MKYLSVCSGIEAATVAWHPLGWTPLAFSEIEPFPRKVLEHHYPDVRLEGDFTLLREQQWIKDADILVGGTPCQAFSVAGLRNSLDDDRGNLTLEFVRLADAIDALRSVPSTIVWENVPGVLSVKDNAFGCFLGALAGEDAPLVAPGGRWSNAGFVDGPKRAIAWRILDAQYFGVAQRRRRLFVVASARTDFDPAQVLFEFEGVRRDIAPSREQGKEVAATVAARFGISRNNHEEVVTQFVGEVAPTLTKEGTGVVRPGFQEDGWYVAACFDRQRSDEYGTDDVASTMSARDYKAATDLVAKLVSPTLDANMDRKWGSNQWVNQGFAIVQPITQFGEIAGTLSARYDSSPCADRGQNMVAQPINIYGGNKRPDRPNGGFYVDENPEISKTLDSLSGLNPTAAQGGTAVLQPMAVTYSIMPQNSGKDYKAREVDVAQPVLAGGPSGGNQGGDYVMQPIPLDLRNSGRDSEKYDAINRQGVGVGEPGDLAHTVTSAFVHGMAQGMAVRRLTPRECERLQGFPDDYTAIPKAADGPRYKALGNSMAVPVMAWIGKRIANALA